MTSETYRAGPDGVQVASVFERLRSLRVVAQGIGHVMIEGVKEVLDPQKRAVFQHNTTEI